MTSKSIYGSFKPTYLYIKQHAVTGKLYFGKTIRDPEKYLGSGKHWVRHIKKHGVEHVETLWYCLFLDEESIKEFALNFSNQQNVVESEDWLNLTPESGIDGGNHRTPHNNETKMKLAKVQIGRTHSENARMKMSKSHLGKKHPTSIVKCPHCSKAGSSNNMMRYHFEKCKSLLFIQRT